jgi:hypothetical protein
MDVSWSDAKRAETNAIARSVDRATITECDDRENTIVAARSSLRAITFASNSAALRFTLTSIAPTPLTSHPYFRHAIAPTPPASHTYTMLRLAIL